MENVRTFIRMFKQLKAILNVKERRKSIVIAVLSIFSALLETLGIGVMLPFIIAMLQPQQLIENKYLSIVFDFLGVNTSLGVIISVGIGVVVVYFIKNIFILGFNRYKLLFRNSLERDLSVKMLKSYMNKPYSFHLDANSSEIMRGINGDNAAVATAVDNFCTLVNEILTCMMLGIALLLINTVMALSIVGMAGIIALVIVIVLRKKISICSKNARKAFADRYRYSYESVNGIKDITVMKRQGNFLNKFRDASFEAASNNTRYLWIAMFPSRLTEIIFITGMVIIVIVSYIIADDVTVVAAQLSAIGVAAVRILPSISNVSNAMNSLVFQRPALENAYKNLVLEKVKDYSSDGLDYGIENKPSFDKEIDVENIFWSYGKDLPNVLNGLSLKIHKGEAIGLIGESGSGKTTLADCILGLFHPQKGDIKVDGKSIFEKSTCWHKLVGYVPQSVFLIDDTIRNNILFGISQEEVDEMKIEKALERAQLSDFVEKQPNGINTILGERGVKISGGQRQRIAIARALYYDPDILVLDEATSALDNETESAVIDAINALQGEKTLIIVAHRLSTIENCNMIYKIVDGKAVCVEKKELFEE